MVCQKNCGICVRKRRAGYMLERSNQLKSSASLWYDYFMLETTLNYKYQHIEIFKTSGIFEAEASRLSAKEATSINKRRNFFKFIEDAADETYLFIQGKSFVFSLLKLNSIFLFVLDLYDSRHRRSMHNRRIL